MPRGMHCGLWVSRAQFAPVSLPLQQIANGCNFGVLRRQKRIYWRCVYYRATSNHAARLGRRCAYNNGVNSIAFGAALWFQITALTPVLSLLPLHF
jgi:hypothetical protein